MMLGCEFAICRDDRLARAGALDPEEPEQGSRIDGLPCVEGRGTADTVGLTRSVVFRVVDILKAILVAEFGQRVGLEAKREIEIEKSGVLAEGKRSATPGDELDRGLQQPGALFRGRELRKALAPVGHIDS